MTALVYILEDVFEGYDYDDRTILGVFTSVELAKKYGNAYRQEELAWEDVGSWSRARYDRDEHLCINRYDLDAECPRVICGTA